MAGLTDKSLEESASVTLPSKIGVNPQLLDFSACPPGSADETTEHFVATLRGDCEGEILDLVETGRTLIVLPEFLVNDRALDRGGIETDARQ